MSATGSLEAVATELGLPTPTHSQDWGIEQSDAQRVNEFAAFFTSRHDQLDDHVRGELVDLVLESANDAAEKGIAFDEAILTRFIALATATTPERIDYWRSLTPSQ